MHIAIIWLPFACSSEQTYCVVLLKLEVMMVELFAFVLLLVDDFNMLPLV